MNDSRSGDHSSRGSSQRARGPLATKSKVGGIAVVLLVAFYSVAAPHINRRTGWNLPQLTTDADGNVRLADAKLKDPREPVTPSPSASNPREPESSGGAKPIGRAESVGTPASESTPTPSTDSDRPDRRSRTNEQVSETRPDTARKRSGAASSGTGGSGATGSGARDRPGASRDHVDQQPVSTSEQLRYGLLREVGRDRYVSPAGLLYTPGSAEGHRLEHLRRHIKDIRGRPGSHGVFDGEMEGALRTIDRAYEKAKKGQRTTKKVDDGRTIYTVDMGGRVGYVGGQTGSRKRNPMARRVRLVLEGNRFITAYPL